MTSGPSARPILEEASTPAVQAKRSTPKHEFEGHEEDICDFIFLHDNVHIVSGSEDGTMRKWNCDTGRLVGKPWKGEGGRIFALALSPDGTIVACGREDGSVQRWTTHGKMIKGVWTGHSKAVHSLSWSPSGSHFSSGSEDGTIFIRQAKSGKVTVGPIETQHNTVLALAYSPSGDRITSGGKFQGMIYIWDAKTGKSVLGPIQFKDRSPVTSLVWLDNTKICCASDLFIRFFDSKSGQLLHRFHHHNHVNSIALSPKHNVLACVGRNGMVELWDTESHESLGQPFHHHDDLYHVSFSRDGRYVAYSGENGKLTLWTVKDIAPQLPAPTLLPQSDRRSTQQETRPNSPSSSCLDADATGGGGFIEEAHDDPYNNFFQSSQQSLPSASPGSHLPNLSLARHFWKGIFRRRPPPDNSIPKERSKRKFFTRRARSDSPLELATIEPNQPVPEGKMGEGEGEQGENINDHDFTNDQLGDGKDEGKQRDDGPPADAQGPPSDDRSPSTHLDSKNNRKFWERLVQARDKISTFGSTHSSTRPAHAPQSILRQPWHWNSSLFPAGSSRRPVDVAACRDEDRYGIAPESDAEAAAAMLRTNDDVANISTRPGQPAVVAQVSQGRPAQTHTSTSGPEEIVYEGVSCCGFFFGHRRHSNLH